MTDAVGWNEQALDEGAADLNLAYKAIKAEIEDLTNDLDKNLSSWVGDDQAAYQAAKDTWTREIGELGDVLDSMSKAVSSIKENYMSTEKKNESIFLQ